MMIEKVIGEFQQAKNSRPPVPEIEKDLSPAIFRFTLRADRSWAEQDLSDLEGA